jgi:hypothetical protein
VEKKRGIKVKKSKEESKFRHGAGNQFQACDVLKFNPRPNPYKLDPDLNSSFDSFSFPSFKNVSLLYNFNPSITTEILDKR